MYGSDEEITVYNNGSFASLTEAYNKGWLSKDDIRDINYHYYEEYDFYNENIDDALELS